MIMDNSSVAGLYLIRMPGEELSAEEREKIKEQETRALPMHLRL
jgi:hypothetical protein